MEMKNLYDGLKDESQKEDVCYYEERRQDSVDFESLLSASPGCREDKAWNFITQYFTAGGKDFIVEGDFKPEMKSSGKHGHTVILYLLGCYLKNIVDDKLSSKLIAIIPSMQKDKWYNFTYSWFLSCLFHDVASKIEGEPAEKFELYSNSEAMFKAVCVEYGIENLFFENDVMKNHLTYSVETYKEYLYYRIKNGSVDHGILGGLLLYDRLYKNYWENHKLYTESGFPSSKENQKLFFFKNLTWRIEHLDHFAFLADSIAAHNIWHQKQEEFENGKCPNIKIENLSQVISQQGQRITLDSSPLAYFLGVLDTIEPSKRFCTTPLEDVLKGISISYDEDHIQINVSSALTEKEEYEKWRDGVQSLGGWLGVTVHSVTSEEIIICMHN